MTDRELMQMALDALDSDNPDIQLRAATALRARLAQPEQEIEPDRDHVEDDGCPTEKAVLQRFWREHQKQEPVAWLITDENINSLQVNSIQRLIDRAKRGHMTDIKLRINGQDEWYQADWLKHLKRTAPPQREWQGLTNDEINNFAAGCHLGKSVQGAIYEAAAMLKEKNGY